MRLLSRKKHKSDTIRNQIKYTVVSIVVVAVVVLTAISTVLNVTNTFSTIERTMTEMAKVTADRLSMELQATTNIVTEMGSISMFSDDEYSPDQKQELIDQKVKTYGMVRGKLIGADGICAYDGIDYSDREYFKRSMKGETFISDPVVSKTDGKLSVMISAPVWKDGKPGTEVVGVIFLTPENSFLNNIVEDIKISKGAECYMLSSSGVTIAHSTPSIAEEQKNTIEMAKTEQSLRKAAELERKMTEGLNGYGIYTDGIKIKLMAYALISGTNGWSVALNAPIMDFMGSTFWGTLICIVVLAISIISGTHFANKLGMEIGLPLTECSERIKLLAGGDLHTPVPEIRSENEIGVVADATKTIVESLRSVIEDTDCMLEQIAGGNFNVQSKREGYYVGDFHGLLDSMYKLTTTMSDTLENVQEAVRQVTLGAAQMAEAAQNLAEGATDQAGSVEELQATIFNVTGMVNDTAGALDFSYKQAKDYEEEAIISSREMKALTEAMKRISETSKQIHDIIAEIEDIASQTNMLSLNAAIEAARAGEAGRGFAVLADQIRKLADDSAQSAVHTRELIEMSIQEIGKGNQIAERTSASLQKVVEGMEDLARSSLEVKETSKAESDAMSQIELAIEQISIVVQNNSATAQETSATSEELSARAVNMDELVAQFQLKQRR